MQAAQFAAKFCALSFAKSGHPQCNPWDGSPPTFKNADYKYVLPPPYFYDMAVIFFAGPAPHNTRQTCIVGRVPKVKGLLQLRFEHDSSTIRLQHVPKTTSKRLGFVGTQLVETYSAPHYTQTS